MSFAAAVAGLLNALATVILILHISGGAVGLVSGALALSVKKGGRLHDLAGRTFLVSMLVMAGIGAGAAPFASAAGDKAPNCIAGVMTLYLLLTSFVAIRRKTPTVGLFERLALAAPILVCAAGAFFALKASHSPSGTVGDTPPQAFYVFMLIGGIGAICDLKVIIKGSIVGPPRLGRHLWRMCVALTIAAGSFFLGQEKVLPIQLQGSPLLFLPVFGPLILMAFWLVRIRIKIPKRRTALAPRQQLGGQSLGGQSSGDQTSGGMAAPATSGGLRQARSYPLTTPSPAPRGQGRGPRLA